MTAPKYVEVENELRKRILSGRYGIEGGIPTAKELAQEFSVVVNTAKVALYHLEGERLIIRRGNSYYVNMVTTVMTQYVLPIAERMRERGRTGYVKTLETVERVTIPEYVANKLDLDHQAILVLQTCISGDMADSEERPMQLSRFYYFMPVTDEQIARMQVDAVYDILLDAPISLSRDDEVFPRFPTDKELGYLNVTSTTPVLNVLSTVRDDKGNILLFQDLTRVPHAVLKYRYAFENRPKS